MKRSIIYILFTILIAAGAFLIPRLIREYHESSIMPTEETEPVVLESEFDRSLTLRIKFADGVEEMSLQEYLIGVLSAEMPEDFPIEAQKAQAVAARTFALKQSQARKHIDADVCTSPACCQGWSSNQNEIAAEAVLQTDGLVITYDNKLIDATYFSCCGSRTEAAVAVWGGEIPYLQSVESPDESDAPRYSEEVVLDASYFAQTLTEHYPLIVLDGSPENWFGKISYTRGGGNDTAQNGGVEISGTDLRTIFSLRSTQIDFDLIGDDIRITTYGFGHRVGMSQYGAKALAEADCKFDDILKHYYQNIELQQLCMKKTSPPNPEETLFFEAIKHPW